MNDERPSADEPRGSSPEGTTERDRQIATALGLFLAVMAVLLLVALPFAELLIDRTLEIAAAVVLAAVAAVFFGIARRRD